MAALKYKIGDKVLIKDLNWYNKNKDLGQYCWEDEMIENKISSESQNPSMLSALERGFIDNIIDTLEFIEKDKAVCYTDEIELLKKIRLW